MAGPKPNDSYSPVPSVQPNGGMPQNYLNVRANPSQFGAQVGQALQGAGKTVGALGEVAMQQAIQEQGMINEAVMTDFETMMNKEFGRIKGNYQSLRGLAAVSAHDKAVEDIVRVRQELSAKAPNEAVRRGFNLLAARQEGFIIREFGEYKAGQIKAADLESAKASADLAIDEMSDPTIATNDLAFDEREGKVDFEVARIVDNLGYLSKDENGNPYFPDDDNGRKAKAVYQKYLNEYKARGWNNRLKTLAFDNRIGSIETAVNILEQNKDRMPPAVYADWSARLAPAYRNEQARSGANALVDRYDDEWESAVSSGATSEGVRSIVEGLLPGITVTSGFRTPEDNKRVGGVDNSYHLSNKALDFTLPEGMTFDEVKKRLQEGGFDAAELIDEKDHIHLAWESKSGTPVSRAAQGYVSKANYYRQNYSKIIDEAEKEAERIHPGDSTFRDNYVARVEQRLNKAINEQNLATRAEQDSVLSFIQGEKTKRPLANIDQIDTSDDPAIRQAVANWRMNDPYADIKMNNLILANSRGKASSYGTQFYKFYTDVVSGKIDNATDLLNVLGVENNSPLTNTGYEILKKVFDDRGTPEGVAWADRTKEFLDSVQLQMTTKIPGVKLDALDAIFQKSLMMMLPRIMAGRAQGKSPAELFDPQSKDYVGKDIQYPTQAQQSEARRQATMQRRALGTSPTASTEKPIQYSTESRFPIHQAFINQKKVRDLQEEYLSGKITKEERDRRAIEQGLAKPGQSKRPETPPPVPFDTVNN